MEDMSFDLEYPSPRFADVPFDDIYKWLCEVHLLYSSAYIQNSGNSFDGESKHTGSATGADEFPTRTRQNNPRGIEIFFIWTLLRSSGCEYDSPRTA